MARKIKQDGSMTRYQPKQFVIKGGRTECWVRWAPSLEQISAIGMVTRDVVFKAGDRIDLIAADYYGDSRLWWFVADLNADRFDDPLNIPVGTLVRVHL
jgi:hypothetical protein